MLNLYFRLQTVTRVDQDYDFRRVQTVTDKFIPIDKPKRRRRQDNKTVVNIFISLQVIHGEVKVVYLILTLIQNHINCIEKIKI